MQFYRDPSGADPTRPVIYPFISDINFLTLIILIFESAGTVPLLNICFKPIAEVVWFFR